MSQSISVLPLLSLISSHKTFPFPTLLHIVTSVLLLLPLISICGHLPFLHIVRSVLLLLPPDFQSQKNGGYLPPPPLLHIVRSVLLLLPLIYSTVAKKWRQPLPSPPSSHCEECLAIVIADFQSQNKMAAPSLLHIVMVHSRFEQKSLSTNAP